MVFFFFSNDSILSQKKISSSEDFPTSSPATSLPWTGGKTCLTGQARRQINHDFRENPSWMLLYEPHQRNSCCCTGLRGDCFHPICICSSASLHPPDTDSLAPWLQFCKMTTAENKTNPNKPNWLLENLEGTKIDWRYLGVKPCVHERDFVCA